MKNFFKKQGGWIMIILIFCFVFLTYYNQALFFQKSPPLSLVVKMVPTVLFNANIIQAKINPPVRLKIPAIGVDAQIEYVALTPNGEMDVPKNPDNVAWFSPGPLPGREGSAVITGHLDDKNGQEVVFYNLNKLSKGDKLFIEDSRGGMITFVVREIRLYDSEAFTPEVFISSEGRHLNLITCAGEWNKTQKKYRQRLVVFSDIYYFWSVSP